MIRASRWLARRAALTPGAVALVCGERRLRYAELESRVARAARALRELGLREGDVVACLLANGLPLVELFHAAARAGTVLLPLNVRLSPEELAFQLRDAGARRLIYGGALAAAAEQAAERAGGVPGTRAPEAGLSELAPDRHETTPPGIGAAGAGDAVADLSSVLAVLYTSGTSGRPKGAELTGGNLLWSALASTLHLGAQPDDCWLACLPLFHVGGLSILVRATLTGTPVVVHERFDAHAVSRALDEDGVTLVSLVPTMLSRVLDARAGRPAPPALRAVLVGGGPAPAPLVERARALGLPVATTYGLTEACSQVATQPAGARGAGAIPLFVSEVRIEGENGAALPAGEAGEICVRGPTVMRGYRGRPEETAAALRGGWLHTGDVGRLDASGALHVLDRRSDLFVSGGENVYPAEIEAVLLAHADVAEAAVAGEPDAELGRRPTAWIVPRFGARPDPESLRAFCRERLAGYKVPRRFTCVDELPRNAAGKVLRRSLLRDRRTSGAVSARPSIRRRSRR